MCLATYAGLILLLEPEIKMDKEEITTFAFLCPPITSQIPHTYPTKRPNNIWTKDAASGNGSNIHLRNVTEF